MADLYPWLKAAHVACALLFVSGLIAGSLFLVASPSLADRVAPLATALRRWDRMITTPSMLGLWAFGIVLAVSGAWFGNVWLQAKLVLVVLLSAIHGFQSGQLRRMSLGDELEPLRALRLIVPAAAAIAVLAVVKP